MLLDPHPSPLPKKVRGVCGRACEERHYGQSCARSGADWEEHDAHACPDGTRGVCRVILMQTHSHPAQNTQQVRGVCGRACEERHYGQSCARCGADWEGHDAHACPDGTRGVFTLADGSPPSYAGAPPPQPHTLNLRISVYLVIYDSG